MLLLNLLLPALASNGLPPDRTEALQSKGATEALHGRGLMDVFGKHIENYWLSYVPLLEEAVASQKLLQLALSYSCEYDIRFCFGNNYSIFPAPFKKTSE